MSVFYRHCPSVSVSYRHCPSASYRHSPSASYRHCPSVSYRHCPSVSYRQCPSVSYKHSPSVSYGHFLSVFFRHTQSAIYRHYHSLAEEHTPSVSYRHCRPFSLLQALSVNLLQAHSAQALWGVVCHLQKHHLPLQANSTDAVRDIRLTYRESPTNPAIHSGLDQYSRWTAMACSALSTDCFTSITQTGPGAFSTTHVTCLSTAHLH